MYAALCAYILELPEAAAIRRCMSNLLVAFEHLVTACRRLDVIRICRKQLTEPATPYILAIWTRGHFDDECGNPILPEFKAGLFPESILFSQYHVTSCFADLFF